MNNKNNWNKSNNNHCQNRRFSEPIRSNNFPFNRNRNDDGHTTALVNNNNNARPVVAANSNETGNGSTEIKLSSNELREFNENLDLSSVLPIESISQSNHINTNRSDGDEPRDDESLMGILESLLEELLDCGASANFISKALV